jgi:hypothetical protein
MSIELIAILVTAAFQVAGLIYIARIARSLDQTVRAYSAANLESTVRLEEVLRQVNDYVRSRRGDRQIYCRVWQTSAPLACLRSLAASASQRQAKCLLPEILSTTPRRRRSPQLEARRILNQGGIVLHLQSVTTFVVGAGAHRPAAVPPRGGGGVVRITQPHAA